MMSKKGSNFGASAVDLSVVVWLKLLKENLRTYVLFQLSISRRLLFLTIRHVLSFLIKTRIAHNVLKIIIHRNLKIKNFSPFFYESKWISKLAAKINIYKTILPKFCWLLPLRLGCLVFILQFFYGFLHLVTLAEVIDFLGKFFSLRILAE